MLLGTHSQVNPHHYKSLSFTQVGPEKISKLISVSRVKARPHLSHCALFYKDRSTYQYNRTIKKNQTNAPKPTQAWEGNVTPSLLLFYLYPIIYFSHHIFSPKKIFFLHHHTHANLRVHISQLITVKVTKKEKNKEFHQKPPSINQNDRNMAILPNQILTENQATTLIQIQPARQPEQ